MSHRPGFELSKQATRKDILKAALPINQEKRQRRRIQITISFQILQHLTWALCGKQVMEGPAWVTAWSLVLQVVTENTTWTREARPTTGPSRGERGQDGPRPRRGQPEGPRHSGLYVAGFASSKSAAQTGRDPRE